MKWLTPLGAVILVAAMVATNRQWADYDIFWHLANGRLMVESGMFPSPDPFSWSMAGQRYIAFSAQVDRLFYLVWQLGGAPALGLFSALLFGLALLPFVLLVGRLGTRPLLEALTLFTIVLIVGLQRGARPHVVAFVLFGLIVYLLERPFGPWKTIVVGVALGVWANAHGSFQVGFGLVGAAVLTWIPARDARAATAAFLALGLGFGLSLLSPCGLRLWTYPLQTVSNPFLVFNQDWASLRPLSPAGAPMGLLLLAALYVGIRRFKDARAMAALGLVLPAIHLVRFTPFAAPLLALATLESLLERKPRLKLPAHSPMLALSRKTPAIAWLLVGAGVVLLVPLASSSIEAATLPAVRSLPTQAVDQLLACGRPAPVWNDYNWGGYLLWRGGAGYTVGIDGRAETLYSNDVFDRYFRVLEGRDGWQAVVQDSPAQYALMPSDAAAAIDNLPGWRRVFKDDVATLSVRDGAPWQCPE